MKVGIFRMERSNLICLLMAATFVLQGCKDDTSSNEVSTLDLKSFQVIRADQYGNDQIFTPLQLESSMSLTLEDRIGAEVFPENVTLVSRVSCYNITDVVHRTANSSESIMANEPTYKYVKNQEVPFSQPVPLYTLMPEEALFRPFNKSSDSLHCSISLSAKNKAGARYVLVKPIEGVVYDLKGSSQLRILENGSTLEYVSNPLPQIQKTQLHQYSLITDNRRVFDKKRLVCETFTIEDQFSVTDYYDLKRIDFSRVKTRKADDETVRPASAIQNQVCRFMIYEQGLLIGFSHYFALNHPLAPPEIRFNNSSTSASLGVGHGRSMTHSDSIRLGDVEIYNPNPFEVYLELTMPSPMVRMQLLGNINEVDGANRVKKTNPSWIYDFLISPELNLPEQEPTRLPGEQPHLIKLEGGQIARLGVLISVPTTCQLPAGKWAVSGNGSYRGGGLFGAYFEVQTPTVALLQPRDPNASEITLENSHAVWFSSVGKLTGLNIKANELNQQYFVPVTEFMANPVADYCRLKTTTIDQR